jgi:hypothetical protein
VYAAEGKDEHMHIEPGVVTGVKTALSIATAAGASCWAARHALDSARAEGVAGMAARAAISTGLVFSFFEILPHYPVGVSEIHLIFGSTLFLLFGTAPAAIGLALGLLIQGLFFAPFDLPQYGMNVTTLIVPLIAVRAISNRIIAEGTPYVDLKYGQALALSVAYQGGVVGWVAFWALYGDGFAASNLSAIATFGGAYLLVILVEPIADLAVLAAAKSVSGVSGPGLVQRRVHTWHLPAPPQSGGAVGQVRPSDEDHPRSARWGARNERRAGNADTFCFCRARRCSAIGRVAASSP